MQANRAGWMGGWHLPHLTLVHDGGDRARHRSLLLKKLCLVGCTCRSTSHCHVELQALGRSRSATPCARLSGDEVPMVVDAADLLWLL